jgi:PPK2 family polyphosphate:nucleotide phosphotransferase
MDPTPSPWLVPTDGSFRLADAPTAPSDPEPEEVLKARLKELRDAIGDRQRLLRADGRFALLLVFQALDAAGKDGTIRAVLRGMDPNGLRVHTFRKPSDEELGHDFLWRTGLHLPRRGRVTVFNRSHYEEVLVVRVQPELLVHQDLPHADPSDPAFWEGRMTSIRDHEAHLARNGTVIRKFFLNVSPQEQARRFLARLEEPGKHWKFSAADVAHRDSWPEYQHAYDEALRATSRDAAPWYVIPADDKPFMRVAVAEIVLETLEALPLRPPPVSEESRQHHDDYRELLRAELGE